MINELTKEQEEAMIPYRDAWIERILKTEHTDDQIKESVNTIYRLGGYDAPKHVIIADSMFAVQFIVNYIEAKQIKDGKDIDIDAAVKELQGDLDYAISTGKMPSGYSYRNFGSTEATAVAWLVYQKYCYDFGLLEPDEYLPLLNEHLGASVSIWAAYYSPDIAVVSRKPTAVRRNDNGELSCDQGKAVCFRDGYGQHYLDGVYFEEELWKSVVSKNLSFKEIMAIQNSDQRTVALKYNPESILNEGAELVHSDNRGNELFLIEGKEINKEWEEDKIWFLKMLCPTGRVFIEGVNPAIVAEYNHNATDIQARLLQLTRVQYDAMTQES